LQPFPSTQREKTMTIPLNYYKVLDATDSMGPAEIQQKCDEMLGQQPEGQYSDIALGCRAHILRAAATCLMDQVEKEEYDETLLKMEPVVEVPMSQVPGVLALLQEVGEMESTVQIGTEYLTLSTDIEESRQDAALALALAYCELGREAMSANPPLVTRGCDFLELALKALQDEGGAYLAPGLQEDIDRTLEDMAPACVLEILARPDVPENETARADALEGLKALLWETAGTSDEQEEREARAELMRTAYPLLTSMEQVKMNAEAPRHIPAEPKEVYLTALAHVAGGFAYGDPSLVLVADELLLQLQEAQAGQPDAQDVSIERGMVCLLLGMVDESIQCLGLESPEGDQGIKSFVEAHRTEDGEILGGMCLLLERWLVEAVLSKFRDTKASAPAANINSMWFEDEEIQQRLVSLERSPSVVSRTADMFSSAAAAVTGAVSVALKAVGETTSKAARSASNVEWPKAAGPAGRREEANEYGYEYDSASVVQEATRIGETEEYVEQQGKLSHATKMALGVALGLTGLGGALWLAAKKRPDLFKMPTKVETSVKASSPTTVTTPATKGQADLTKPEALDVASAKALVEKWQHIKAQALGGKHTVSLLGDILDGYMLTQWKARANDVRQHGWYWEYTLVGLKIDSVVMSENNTKATVQATLQEAAQLYDRGRPDNNDAYRSTYCARYEMNFRPGLGWRISSGAVLY